MYIAATVHKNIYNFYWILGITFLSNIFSNFLSRVVLKIINIKLHIEKNINKKKQSFGSGKWCVIIKSYIPLHSYLDALCCHELDHVAAALPGPSSASDSVYRPGMTQPVIKFFLNFYLVLSFRR